LVFEKRTIQSLTITFLFLASTIPMAVFIAPASASAPATLAAKPLSLAEANWADPDGPFGTSYSPQNVINSSNAQNLGISWLFPLPAKPGPLVNTAGGIGLDAAPLIVNGTIYAVSEADQVFALNAASGNVLWTVVLPVTPNSTAGKGLGTLSLHLHDDNEQFTTKLFGNTPTFWIAAGDEKVYALSALNGQYELNFSIFDGPKTVDGNNPGALYHTNSAAGILVDQNRGIVVTSVISIDRSDSGRCFYRGWNVLVSPPTLAWTAFCTPPQPGGNIPVDPYWEIKQVNSMKSAQIFYPGPQYNGGGYMPSTAVVDLKKLSPAQLNSTLYDDWGYVNQTPDCRAWTAGAQTGSTAAGWGAPWLLGSGPTDGLAFVNTNNKDPYGGPCTPGPDLWSASILALNVTNGNWVWGFQAIAHDLWDYDCSWWQALGNETINGVNTPVLWKTCKAGYLFELNALNGNMIWAWTPTTSIEYRCTYCYMLNPLNRTEMTRAFFNPSLQPSLCSPCTFSFESESAYNPTLNYLYTVSQNYPQFWTYVSPNSTNYRTSNGLLFGPIPGQKATFGTYDNATVEAVNAATGQMVWSRFMPNQGYRGGVTTSGTILFLMLAAGDIMMLNAQTGELIKDYFIGGPLNVHPSIGATAGGTVEIVFPIFGRPNWGGVVPGNIVALQLQQRQGGATTTITSSVTSTTTISGATSTTTISGATTATVTSVLTAAGTGGGVDSTLFYGVAAVAVIFIIATGYLAMSRRKPAP
jgi:outer membrane protein assembly factor BamB